jgi:hypothetical protein
VSCPAAPLVRTESGLILQPGAPQPYRIGERKDLKLGTLKAAVRQLGLEWQAFEHA